ncbi:MAG: ABC transporter ATP-binding protein [Spirochaetes bacterium]|nr:ABC transporter ATP-binding protein [Spirochaetota bacterium]
MIQIRKLYKSYDDVTALNAIDLDIREGSITGLLGPNGAGKTTLVSILTGVLKKNDGQVTVQGLDLDRNPDEIKAITGMVPQSLALYPLLTARENLEYFGTLYGLSGKRLRDRIAFSSEAASLQPFINRRAGKFSGGMQRRLNLAIGLLNDPKILYLDEPTVGVDAQSRRYMLDTIRRINAERCTTIVYTSHYISEIEQISDDIVILDEGSIILSGSKEDILSSRDALAIQVDSISGAVSESLSALAGVTCETGVIYVEKNDLLAQSIIRVASILRDAGATILNMHYDTNRLEELYLHLTKKELRDEE